jgi:fructokinase
MVNVIGEALIDLVRAPEIGDTAANDVPRYVAYPGGSPFNVAIGLARLGQPTQLQARLANDAFGRQLRAHAHANGVDLSLAVAATQPTTLAIVGLDEQRNATYDFYLDGTADWQWTTAELNVSTTAIEWVHTGSLASWTEPGSSVIEHHLSMLRQEQSVVISYDPNIRPQLMADRDAAVAAVERFVRLAHVVKASAEDLAWLYPTTDVDAGLRRWRDLGPAMVVVTDGENGAHAITDSGQTTTVAALAVDVVDTVGAGDAFMAGLINAVARAGLTATARSANGLRSVLREAMLVAALTVGKAGANPPTAAELTQALEDRRTA